MYGTGEEEYDDLSECMVTLLQVQADYAASQDADTGFPDNNQPRQSVNFTETNRWQLQ